MQNIFIKPIKVAYLGIVGFLSVLGTIAGLGYDVKKFINTYLYYSIGAIVLYYFILVYVEWKNQKEQKKQAEEHEKEKARLKEEHEKELKQKQEEMELELENIKQRFITKDPFNPRDTVQIMELINTKFTKKEWYPPEALWSAIYEINFTPYNSHFKKEIMVGLAEKGLIKTNDDYGRLYFMKK